MRMRSWLCAPALRSNLLEKALEAHADIALFDLEDSVPADRKEAARAHLSHHFAAPMGIASAIRLNGLRTYDGLKDLLFLVDRAVVPEFLVLPKALLPGDPILAASVFAQRGLRTPAIFCVIETAQSLWSLRSSGGFPGGLGGLIFGAADFAADLGVPPLHADLRLVRQEIALTARRLGVVAIDSPCFQLRSEVRVRREGRAARGLGFHGKIAIHPAQVTPINELFTESEQAVDHARRLVERFESNPDSAIQQFDDAMVGPPFIRYARSILSANR